MSGDASRDYIRGEAPVTCGGIVNSKSGETRRPPTFTISGPDLRARVEGVCVYTHFSMFAGPSLYKPVVFNVWDASQSSDFLWDAKTSRNHFKNMADFSDELS